jgi:hypothetical protein
MYQEPECTCEQIDVDVFSARNCDAHRKTGQGILLEGVMHALDMIEQRAQEIAERQPDYAEGSAVEEMLYGYARAHGISKGTAFGLLCDLRSLRGQLAAMGVISERRAA